MDEKFSERIDESCGHRWEMLVDEIVADVSSHGDANLEGSRERCKTTWECYADFLWQSGPFKAMYETELVDPACVRAINRFSKFETTVLFAWMWNDYAEDNDPDVDSPEKMSEVSRRRVLFEKLQKDVQARAMSDGCEIEERAFRDAWGEVSDSDPDNDA